MSERPIPWSREEVEATVADYFHMLKLELAGQRFSKAEHRRALLKMLDGRSAPAVELKHCNISAILIELGCPYIEGYKPRGNYQSLLFEVVADRVEKDDLFNRVALDAVERPAIPPILKGPAQIIEEPPALRPHAAHSPKAAYDRGKAPVKRDYLAREARNRELGLAGEEFVVAIERARLIAAGKERLADRVDHVSMSRGDGLGFDVLSFEATGADRFVEVKTTAFGKETPFYLSRGEIEFSKQYSASFQLYRLFDFRREPRLFQLKGAVDRHCHLDPVTFVARFD